MGRAESELPVPSAVRELPPDVPTLTLFVTGGEALGIEVPDRAELYFVSHG